MKIGDVVSLDFRGSLPKFVGWLSGVFLTTTCWAAVPTAVNQPIVDDVTRARVQLLGNSPAAAMGDLYIATASALSVIGLHDPTMVRPQQSTIIAQNSNTAGMASLSNLGTTASPLATRTIPGAGGLQALPAVPAGLEAEGILGGASLLMFNLEGNHAPFADYYVVSDQGFDYYTDQDENLVMFAHQVRTFGTSPFPATDVGFLLPANSIANYLPQLLESSPSDLEIPSSVDAQAADAPLRDIYIGVKYADGTTTFYEGSLELPYSVPEPSSFVLAFVGLIAIYRLRR